MDTGELVTRKAEGDDMYHCPNKTCEYKCVFLAELFKHLEEEDCRFISVEKAQ